MFDIPARHPEVNANHEAHAATLSYREYPPALFTHAVRCSRMQRKMFPCPLECFPIDSAASPEGPRLSKC